MLFCRLIVLFYLLVQVLLILQDGISPLLAACRGGHTETAQSLIDKGADVNQCDEVD